MQAAMASSEAKVVILGTGGTIAGTADSATDSVGYRAARLGVDALIASVPPLAAVPLEAEQAAQLDSKDMSLSVWLALVEAVRRHLLRPEVAGLVITHGTDTLEETAYFLHRLLAPAKPVVLTAAMRPATSLLADGPQNLLDAVTVARAGTLVGVLAVLGGTVFAAADVRKQHGWRIGAFGAGDAGPLALVQDGMLLPLRLPLPAVAHAAASAAPAEASAWPVVEIITSHAGARGAVIDALVADGVQGIVIAGTGNGSIHQALLDAARRAIAAGVPVVRASRCLLGGVFGAPDDALPSYGALTPWQARIELTLDLLKAVRR
jgi:L-asparaginase